MSAILTDRQAEELLVPTVTLYRRIWLTGRQAQGDHSIPRSHKCAKDSRGLPRRGDCLRQFRRCDAEKVRGAAGEEVDKCSKVAEEGSCAPVCITRYIAHAFRCWNSSSAIRAYRTNWTPELQPHFSERIKTLPAGYHALQHGIHFNHIALR
jgi:hypothetical protein